MNTTVSSIHEKNTQRFQFFKDYFNIPTEEKRGLFEQARVSLTNMSFKKEMKEILCLDVRQNEDIASISRAGLPENELKQELSRQRFLHDCEIMLRSLVPAFHSDQKAVINLHLLESGTTSQKIAQSLIESYGDALKDPNNLKCAVLNDEKVLKAFDSLKDLYEILGQERDPRQPSSPSIGTPK